MYGKDGVIYLDALVVDSHIKLNFIDRVRVVCGSRLAVHFEVLTQRNFGKHEAHSAMIVEKVFPRIKALFERTPPHVLEEECPEPQNP